MKEALKTKPAVWQRRLEKEAKAGAAGFADAERMASRLEEDRQMATEAAWPPRLIRSMDDTWYFALRLRSGELVHFQTAHLLSREWARLDGAEIEGASPDLTPAAWPERGLDVRVSDIVWIIEAST